MSASHNPGGPDYDWGIKVVIMHEPGLYFCLYVLLPPVAFGFANPNLVSIINPATLCIPNS